MPTICGLKRARLVCVYVCLHEGGPLLQQNRKLVYFHYIRPDSQFNDETRFKWPIITLKTYEKVFDTNLTLRPLIPHIISCFIAIASARRWKTSVSECVKWTATLKHAPTPTGLRNIDTKSTEHKHNQAVNMNSSF